MIAPLLLPVVAELALAAIPPIMTYSGRLYTNTGTPLAGVHEIEVRIYDQAVGGTTLFLQTFSAVPTTDGYFSVELTDDSLTSVVTDPLNAEALFAGGEDRYLQLTVDDEVLLPRQRLGAVPWAFAAGPPAWDEVRDVPADFADGVDDGLTSVSWSEVLDRPSGFVDGVDNDLLAGLTCAVGQFLVRGASGWTCSAAPALHNCSWVVGTTATSGSTAVCPAGRHIVSGGCFTSTGGSISQSYPADEDGEGILNGEAMTHAVRWHCGAQPTSSYSTAYALCCQL